MNEAGEQQVPETETKYRLRNIRNVPMGVKAALIADAEREARSVTDVANCILADYFQTECPEAFNQPRTDPTLGDQLQLRLPHNHPLWGAFWSAARNWATTESSAVINVLASHYQLPYQRVRRGRKPNKAPQS